MKLFNKIKISFFLLLPPVLLSAFTLLLFTSMGHHNELFGYSLFLLVIAFFISSLEIFIFFKYVSPKYIEVEKLRSLLEDQQNSAKMLVRRDLELTRANEKLRELDQVKSDFISVVAHQLRTPLSGMKWTLSMLIGGDMGPLNNDQKTFLMKSYESNARMITLVNDMLVADGIQSGRVHYGFKHIDIIDLMDNVLFELGSQASKKNISIVYKSKFENLPQAYVDPETMRAVLQNLLENAIKYTMEGGKIEVDVKQEPSRLVISISDNGIGVPQDQRGEVFGKFFRARNAIKQVTDGSGLGLYITKTIVEKNGGTIWFESEEGRGSTFYFTVPT